MAHSNYDYHLTINILGDEGVGKTQIGNRFIYGTFKSSSDNDKGKFTDPANT